MNSELIQYANDQKKIFEAIRKIESLEKNSKELPLTAYQKEQLSDLKETGLNKLLNSFDLIKPDFNGLIRTIEQRGSIGYFLSLYKEIYKPSPLTDELREKYVRQVLGEDIEKSNINVFIKEDEYKTRPVVYFIYKKTGLDIKNEGKLTEEETLELIESKQIVISYSTVYKDYEDRPHFFCAIDECLDLNDVRVVDFTLKNYPFIYRDLRNSITVRKVEEDRRIYSETIKQEKAQAYEKLTSIKEHTM